jgi:hypothetical protein
MALPSRRGGHGDDCDQAPGPTVGNWQGRLKVAPGTTEPLLRELDAVSRETAEPALVSSHPLLSTALSVWSSAARRPSANSAASPMAQKWE